MPRHWGAYVLFTCLALTVALIGYGMWKERRRPADKPDDEVATYWDTWPAENERRSE